MIFNKNQYCQGKAGQSKAKEPVPVEKKSVLRPSSLQVDQPPGFRALSDDVGVRARCKDFESEHGEHIL